MFSNFIFMLMRYLNFFLFSFNFRSPSEHSGRKGCCGQFFQSPKSLGLIAMIALGGVACALGGAAWGASGLAGQPSTHLTVSLLMIGELKRNLFPVHEQAFSHRITVCLFNGKILLRTSALRRRRGNEKNILLQLLEVSSAFVQLIAKENMQKNIKTTCLCSRHDNKSVTLSFPFNFLLFSSMSQPWFLSPRQISFSML